MLTAVICAPLLAALIVIVVLALRQLFHRALMRAMMREMLLGLEDAHFGLDCEFSSEGCWNFSRVTGPVKSLLPPGKFTRISREHWWQRWD